MIKLVPGLFHNEQNTKRNLAKFITSTDRLSIGPECAGFERQFSTWQGRKYTVLYNSGSSANLALIQALINLGRIKPPDKAAFSAITWATNVMPLIQLGLCPTPIDIELNTLNVSSQKFADALTQHPDIKLLFLTNLLGFCGDIDRIKRVCDKQGIILIEDNCESLGTVYQGVKLGNWSLASTFSFFVGHHMSTIEGGAVCTDDAELARMLTLVRAHGWDRNLEPEHKQNIRAEHQIPDDFFANFTFYTLGYNLRPTEITGFLGQQQLPFLDHIIDRRHHNYHRFHNTLIKNEDIIPLATDHIDIISNFAIPIICRAPKLSRQYIRAFTQADVEIRPIMGGAITTQPFYKQLAHAHSPMPNAELVSKQGFYFPNHEGLTEPELALLHQTCTTAPQPAAKQLI